MASVNKVKNRAPGPIPSDDRVEMTSFTGFTRFTGSISNRQCICSGVIANHFNYGPVQVRKIGMSSGLCDVLLPIGPIKISVSESKGLSESKS